MNVKNAEKLAAKGIKMVSPQGRLLKIVLYDVPAGDYVTTLRIDLPYPGGPPSHCSGNEILQL